MKFEKQREVKKSMKDEHKTKKQLLSELATLRKHVSKLHAQKIESGGITESQEYSDIKYRELADSMPQVICETDDHGHLTFVNQNAFNAYGYTQKDFDEGVNVLQILIPEDRERAKSNIQKIMKGEVIGPNEYTALRKDGSTFPVIIHSNPIIHGGKYTGLRAIVIDITERKEVEKKLRESEEKFKTIFENANDAIIYLDTRGKILDVNTKAVQILAGTKEDVLGKHFTKVGIFSLKDIPKLLRNFTQALASKTLTMDKTIKNKKGREILLECSTTVVRKENHPAGLIVIARDITERKQAEEKLRESEERLKQISDTIEDVVWITDWTSHKILFANPAYEKIWGRSVQDLYDNFMDWANAIHPDDRQHAWETFVNLDQKDTYDEEYRVVRPDGSIRWVRDRGFPISDESGQIYRVAGIAQDITERKNAEQRQKLATHVLELLNQSEEKSDLIRDILLLIKESTECEAVGIRLKDGEDFPYYEVLGFPTEFVEAERYLCARDGNGKLVHDSEGNPILECMCGNVISGKTDPSHPFFTEGGSFWTNSTTDLLSSSTEEDRQGRTRNRCHGEGYESVALIPLRSDKEIIGLLQLNDRRKDRITLEMLQFYEGLGASIGIALSRKKAREILEIRERQQKGVAQLGRFALRGTDLSTLFDKAVALVTQILNIEYSKILELLPDGKALLLRSGVGWHKGLVGSATVGIEKNSQAGYTLLSQEPVVVRDLRSEKRFTGPPLLHNHGVISGMSVIIGDMEKPFGVFGAHTSRYRVFTKDDVHFLQNVANIVASSIERKRIEEFLRVEKDKMHNILNNMNDLVIIENKNYTILYENKRTIELYGDIVGKKCYEAFRNREEPCSNVFCAVDHFLKQGNTEPSFYNTKTDGGISWETFAIPIVDEKGDRVVLEIARDITQQEQIRNQLLQSEKMSALGQLISGVAHELNNPMAGVLGYTQLLLMSEDLPENTKSTLEKINQEAERARKIVQNLLTFARQRKPEKKRIALHKIINRTLDLRAYELKVNNIEVLRTLDSDLPATFADEHQLQQVFMNLIINAEQAMLEAHKKGRLEVSTRWNEERGKIQISFRDDGPGIPEEYASKIFDPFFTTKPDGKGTGWDYPSRMGLCRNTVDPLRRQTSKAAGPSSQ